MTRRSVRVAAALVSLGLVAAACGSDDSTATPTEDTADEASSDDTAGDDTASDDTTGDAGDDGGDDTTGDDEAPSTTAAGSDDGGSAIQADTSRRLRLIGTNGVQHMDPVTGVTPCEAEMLRWVYDGLIRLRPDGSLAPGLAESWEAVDDSTFVLNLREGVLFQDGTPFNAEAVKLHLDRGRDDPESTISGQLESVESVEVLDDLTVQINLSEPRVGILPQLLTNRAGMVPSPTAVEAAGDTYGANGAVGAGPYVYDSHTPAEDIRVSAWDGYWDQENRHLAGIDMLGAASEFQIERIASGEVDYAALKDTDLPFAIQGADDGVVEYQLSPVTQYAEIYVNWEVEPFDDVNVRRALMHAIDRELLADVLTEGAGTPAYSPLPANSWAHDPAVNELYPYDPELARQLLADAGYPDGVTLTVGQIENPYYTRLAQAVQDMVAASGFFFELESVTGAEINNRLYQIRDLPIAVTAFAGNADPGLTLEQKFATDANSNPAGTTADGIDELLEAGAASVEQDERAEAYKAAERIIMEEALSIPLFHNGGLVAYVPEFKGVERGYTTCGFGDFVNAEVYFALED